MQRASFYKNKQTNIYTLSQIGSSYNKKDSKRYWVSNQHKNTPRKSSQSLADSAFWLGVLIEVSLSLAWDESSSHSAHLQARMGQCKPFNNMALKLVYYLENTDCRSRGNLFQIFHSTLLGTTHVFQQCVPIAHVNQICKSFWSISSSSIYLAHEKPAFLALVQNLSHFFIL